MSKLLETFQELNLSNYGPDDVDQLNAWAIDAYAELAAPKTQEPVAEFFALDDGIGTIMAAWADGFEPVVGQMLYAAPVISAKQQVALPEWAPCNPGCDPEFNGQRSAGCARYCENARAAMLVAAPAPAPAPAPVSEAKVQDFEPLVCDYCNAETQDPWHGSGMLNGVESRHIHACSQCRNLLPTAKALGVVIPERLDIPHRDEFESSDQYAAAVGESKKWNACLDEVARLNAAPVQRVSVPGGWKLVPVNATEAILDVLYSNGMDESDSLLQDIWSAMLAAAPAAPAADAQCDQLRAEADYYRFTLRNVLKDLRDDLARGGMAPSWEGVADTISMVLSHDRAALAAHRSASPAHGGE